MYTLILIVVSLGQYPAVTSIDFDNSATCLKALSTSLELEGQGLKIKARCVPK
jgi:hypothetical protein